MFVCFTLCSRETGTDAFSILDAKFFQLSIRSHSCLLQTRDKDEVSILLLAENGSYRY